MKYIVEFGRANTGLSPVLDKFVRLDTLASVAAPLMTEIPGTGAYFFDFVFPDGATYDIYFSVDSRSSLLGAIGDDSRYRTGVASPSDAFLDKKISAVGSTDVATIVNSVNAARDSIKGVANKSITDVTTKTDNLPADPASQSGVGAKVDAGTAAVQSSVNVARQTIQGIAGRSVSDVYDKVSGIPADVAGQTATNQAIATARAELDARIDAAKTEIETNLGQTITTAQTELDGRIDAAKASIKGPNDKSISDVDTRTQNLPADPSSQSQVIAQIAAARDSVNGTVMSATALIKGPESKDCSQIYDKVQNLPNTQLAEQSAVAAIPGQVRDLIGGLDFDGTKDTLHQIRGQEDTQSTTLAQHSSLLIRVLGMLHENSVLDQTAYDSENNLTAGRLRVYDTAAHAQAAYAAGEGDDSTPGKLAEYAIAGSYVGGLLESYAVTRILPA